jgi:hypothetical protein
MARAGSIWVSGQGDGVTMVKIDARTGEIEARFAALALEGIGDDDVWVNGPWQPNGAIRRLDPITGVLDDSMVHTAITPVDIAQGAGQLWMARWVYYCDEHFPEPEGPPLVAWELARFDPVTLARIGPFIPLGGAAQGASDLEIGFGALWTPGLHGLLRVPLDMVPDGP